MRRVTRPGGIVACGTFDFWGGFSAAEHIIEIGATLDEDMRVIRDYRRARPLFWPKPDEPEPKKATPPLGCAGNFG